MIHRDLAALPAIGVAHQQGHGQLAHARQVQPGCHVEICHPAFIGREGRAGDFDDAHRHRADQAVVVLHGASRLVKVRSYRCAGIINSQTPAKLCASAAGGVTRLAV
ncbi:hypothetical protein D3C84_1019000 [compost metagenome]